VERERSARPSRAFQRQRHALRLPLGIGGGQIRRIGYSSRKPTNSALNVRRRGCWASETLHHITAATSRPCRALLSKAGALVGSSCEAQCAWLLTPGEMRSVMLSRSATRARSHSCRRTSAHLVSSQHAAAQDAPILVCGPVYTQIQLHFARPDWLATVRDVMMLPRSCRNQNLNQIDSFLGLPFPCSVTPKYTPTATLIEVRPIEPRIGNRCSSSRGCTLPLACPRRESFFGWYFIALNLHTAPQRFRPSNESSYFDTPLRPGSSDSRYSVSVSPLGQSAPGP